MWDRIDAEVARRSGSLAGKAKRAAVDAVPLGRSGQTGEIASVVADGGLLRH
jgi:hypothetical protein